MIAVQIVLLNPKTMYLRITHSGEVVWGRDILGQMRIQILLCCYSRWTLRGTSVYAEITPCLPGTKPGGHQGVSKHRRCERWRGRDTTLGAALCARELQQDMSANINVQPNGWLKNPSRAASKTLQASTVPTTVHGVSNHNRSGCFFTEIRAFILYESREASGS